MKSADRIRNQRPGGRTSHDGSGVIDVRSLGHDSLTGTVSLLESHLAVPRTMPIMPSVTMKGTTRSPVIRRPLTSPQAPPASTPRSRQKTGGIDSLTKRAVTTLTRAITDPTLRSMPALMITIVMPMAPRATITVWTAISLIVKAERNEPSGTMQAKNM